MNNKNLSPVGKNKSMQSIIDEYVDQYKNDTDRIHKQYEDYREMMKNDPKYISFSKISLYRCIDLMIILILFL